MSKKIASGADAIVLDVKTGAGAFMKDIDDAKQLAKAMVSIGKQVGRNTMAVISDMSQPLGLAIGNALEVKEAIETLQGKGPKDLTELCLVLGSQMVLLAEKASSLEEARQMLEENLSNGRALEHFKLFLSSQGGDASVVDQTDLLPKANHQIELSASKSGTIETMIADDIGTAAMMLGAGRATKESEIDLAAGIMLHKKVGDSVQEGEALLTIHSNSPNVESVINLLQESIVISEKEVHAPKLVYEMITE